MKGKQTALIPGNEDHVGYWLTPAPLMAQLQAEFDFTMDAAPFPRPPGWDGLKEPWGQRTYCNPPFAKGMSIHGWVRKAIQERDSGKLVVLVLPVAGWMELLLPAEPEIRYLGRVAWVNEEGEATHRARFPSSLFILRPKA